ncbi:unnamed protein product [Linum tenue]|uniref:Uncharacterized protein n=1 Tax=Linum tenue TaxID=586396 RepID=A0AAV0LR29_9ROSI|nr:unnamed protein product [Linum tenue]
MFLPYIYATDRWRHIARSRASISPSSEYDLGLNLPSSADEPLGYGFPSANVPAAAPLFDSAAGFEVLVDLLAVRRRRLASAKDA